MMMRHVNRTRFTDATAAAILARDANRRNPAMSGYALSPTDGCIGTPRRRGAARTVGRAPTGTWLSWLGQSMRAIATRRQLAQMEDRMLKDIGISRTDALEEARRAPWDIGPKGV